MRTNQHQQQGALDMRTTSFPRRPEAVGPARKWAMEEYRRAGGSESQAETCALLVSELVTNAVEYTDGKRVEVRVWTDFRVDVIDSSTEKPEMRGPENDEDEHGRGLVLVQLLSSHFEVTVMEDSKICSFWLDEG
ncbi:ATP-binding protein [Streptomyces sp. W16]|uniref:ATP-binding protein n=1 Tax=Streptomyces sp. W16 TaxID=3076631 RepID=UPI00295AD727|nr:ATP-binding protein [Streptomyces sp. W16]MDV9174122.1 ATP-binding protein [Streptomyces sp. W16]